MYRRADYTRKIADVRSMSADKHYRSTHLPEGTEAPVYVEVKASWHESHEHHAQDLDRFGHAVCHGCGAQLWSPAWVADGVFGEGTGEYVADMIRRNESIAWGVVEPVLVAAIEPDEPASTRRAGVPVRPMMLGNLERA